MIPVSLLLFVAILILVLQLFLSFSVSNIRKRIRILETDQLRNEGSRSNVSFTAGKTLDTRRIKFRAETKLESKVSVEDKQISAYVRDLSVSGARLECGERDLRLENVHLLEIKLNEKEIVKVMAKIVRHLDEPGTYGVAFQDLSISRKRMIAEYVSQKAKLALIGEPESTDRKT